MSNIIPPLLSDSPPPPPPLEDDEDDEFGDFTGTNDFAFSCDNTSLPNSPFHSSKKQFDSSLTNETLDINRNTKDSKVSSDASLTIKDFQDRRKGFDITSEDISNNKNGVSDNIANKQHENNCNTQPPSILKKLSVQISAENQEQFGITVSKGIAHNQISKESSNVSEQIKKCDQKQNDLSTNNGFLNRIEINHLCEQKMENINTILDENNISNEISTEGSNTNEEQCNEIIKGHLKNQGESTADTMSKENDIPEHKQVLTYLESENESGLKQSNNSGELEISGKQHCVSSRQDIRTECNNFKQSKEGEGKFAVEFGEFSVSTPVMQNENEISCQQKNEESAIIENTKPTKQISENIFMDVDKINSKPVESSMSGFNITEENAKTTITKESDDASFADFDDDEFGDFISEININRAGAEDEFADFTSVHTLQKPKKPIVLGDDDDFDDFTSWEQSSNVQKVDESEPHFDVDFSANSTMQSIDHVDINESNVFERAEYIFKQVFPIPAEENEEETECLNLDEIIKTDLLYNQIEDFTQAHALKFQYAKSQCREILLNALNIDIRNIFPGMPRFAANLGPTPLEPIKSDVPATALVPKPKQEQPLKEPKRVEVKPVEVPSAQFDWSGSGLQNPLDSMTAKGPQIATQPKVSYAELQPAGPTLVSTFTKTNLSAAKCKADLEVNEPPLDKFSDFTSHQLTSIISSKKDGLIISKTDTKKVKEEGIEDEFCDFASHQSYDQPKTYNVILRETHISNQVKVSNDELLNNVNKDISDDFDDFQVAVPEITDKNVQLNSDLTVKPLEGIKSKPNLSMKVDYNTQKILEKLTHLTNNPEQIEISPMEPNSFSDVNIKQVEAERNPSKNQEFNDLILSEPIINDHSRKEQSIITPTPIVPLTIKEAPKVKELSKPSFQTENDNDDEFTDFHSSEVLKDIVPQAVATILEPLRPSVVPIQHKQQQSSTQNISWPNPGITDDDIRNIELNYSRVQDTPKNDIIQLPKGSLNVEESIATGGVKVVSKQSSSKENIRRAVKEAKKPVVKQNSTDDEWSDFVSVKKSSPIHKLQEKERSATPDLPLSVLNLSNLQPAKKPIPVITPQGLIQTKLSSSVTSPTAQSSTRVMQPKIEQSLPSIISNQYASHMPYGSYNSINSVPSQHSRLTQSSSNADEDDWSDFVSHQTSNVPKKVPVNQNVMQYGNWMSATPNIITNPVSFDTLQGGSGRQQVRRAASQGVQPKKYAIPGISMPELGFAAPKNRTSHKK